MYTVKTTHAPMTSQLQSNREPELSSRLCGFGNPRPLEPLSTRTSGVVVVVMVTLALVIVLMRVLVVSVVVMMMVMLMRDARILAEHE